MILLCVVTAIVIALPITEVNAGRFDEMVETLLKKPLRNTDKIDRPLLTRVSPQSIVPNVNRADDELLRQFNRLEGVNDEMRGLFKTLSASERSALVELVSAGQRVARGRDPDSAIALIRYLDADGLIQGRTYGDFVYAGVDKMGPTYKSVVKKMGEGAGRFYNEVIEPHWGKWTAAGLTAAYLAAPEKFHDALGNLTEYAVQKLAEAGIRVGEAATGGVAKGIIARVKANPIFSLLTLAILSLVLLWQVPLLRYLITQRVLKPLWTVPVTEQVSAAETIPKPKHDYEE